MKDFKDSKIQYICYHGTDSESFTVLNKEKIQKNPEDGDAGYFGWGFYLTRDKEYAEEYGNNILEFKVDIENPYDFSNIDGESLVNFIFKDCKNLNKRVEETLFVIYQIGRQVTEYVDLESSDEVLDECISIYQKYKNKEVDDKYIEDVKNIMIKLSPVVDNWMSGLFFYFGRELFHYFTFNGYDGVVVKEGKEVVVYETKQLKEVGSIEEDVDFEETPIPDWKAGAEEFTRKIKEALANMDGIHDIEWCIDSIAPLRLNAVWWDGVGTFLTFKYKDLAEIGFYASGDLWIYPDSDDDDEVIDSIDDLEEYFIFTDEQFQRFMADNDIWGSGADDFTSYFGFYIVPLKNNTYREIFYSYDIGYEDYFDLGELFRLGRSDGPFKWVVDELIPDFLGDYPEFSGEEDDESENNLEQPGDRISESKETKTTKGKILSDVIREFGILKEDEDLPDAIYILPNGDIMDTKGSKDKSQHENVAEFISNKYHIKDLDENNGSKLMLNVGAMRVTPWIPAMFIPKKIITDEQENSLYNILDTLKETVSEDKPLMIATPDGDQQIEYSKIEDPEEIIDSMRGFQIFGVLKQ